MDEWRSFEQGGFGQGYGGSLYGGEYGWSGGSDYQWRGRGQGERGSSWFGGGEPGRYGEHRGRGPKNYVRPDDRIREDVSDRLSDDAWIDASEIEVQVGSGEVTLSGTVRTRDDKHRAEAIAEQVSGVKHVQNNLRTQAQGGGASGPSTHP